MNISKRSCEHSTFRLNTINDVFYLKMYDIKEMCVYIVLWSINRTSIQVNGSYVKDKLVKR
jgi:hypothetical protein